MQALTWCGDWCGLPIPDCRQCTISACYAYQISADTEQKRSLTQSEWLVEVRARRYLTSAGSGYIPMAWIGLEFPIRLGG